MKILFIGTTGVHHSLVAAHWLVHNDLPDKLTQIAGFADNTEDHKGLPILVGHDNRNNEVYSLGAGRDVLMAKKTIEELLGVLGFYPHDLLIKPIQVRGDRLFPFINKVCSVGAEQGMRRMMARYLSSGPVDSIISQVEGFREHYQLH